MFSRSLLSALNLHQPNSHSKHLEFMANNLRARLDHHPDNSGPSEPQISVRHDLFEIDRKRKHLLDEVETIKRMKLEQVRAISQNREVAQVTQFWAKLTFCGQNLVISLKNIAQKSPKTPKTPLSWFQIEEVETIKRLKVEQMQQLESLKRERREQAEEIEAIKRLKLKEADEAEAAKQLRIQQSEELNKLCKHKEACLKEINMFKVILEASP